MKETSAKKAETLDIVRMLDALPPVQVDVVRAIIQSFADKQANELLRNDFLTEEAFEYFAMPIAKDAAGLGQDEALWPDQLRADSGH
jgi:hypothetical protein